MFSAIYELGRWGYQFYSGYGSHDPEITEPYIGSVTEFLYSLRRPCTVVDLGCGDFNIGRQIAPCAAKYIACDVARNILRRNRAVFPDIDFRELDMTTDVLPPGDICTVRQVFQHLDNRRIAKAIRAIMTTYPIWIITEHIPSDSNFPRNVDMPIGDNIRLFTANSGVDLNAPPFDFHGYTSQVLCEVSGKPGIIRTQIFYNPETDWCVP